MPPLARMKGGSMKKITLTVAFVTVLASVVAAQVRGLPTSEATAFIGTWVFAMSNPSGAQETVRVWDKDGLVAASVQAGKFPPIDVSAVLKDGDMLVLTATRFENGRPVRAVIALMPEGDGMKMAQMLEFSETIKRGTGTRQ
jgi:hypothetical protein